VRLRRFLAAPMRAWLRSSRNTIRPTFSGETRTSSRRERTHRCSGGRLVAPSSSERVFIARANIPSRSRALPQGYPQSRLGAHRLAEVAGKRTISMRAQRAGKRRAGAISLPRSAKPAIDARHSRAFGRKRVHGICTRYRRFWTRNSPKLRVTGRYRIRHKPLRVSDIRFQRVTVAFRPELTGSRDVTGSIPSAPPIDSPRLTGSPDSKPATWWQCLVAKCV